MFPTLVTYCYRCKLIGPDSLFSGSYMDEGQDSRHLGRRRSSSFWTEYCTCITGAYIALYVTSVYVLL
jgi:hypothetical protein